MKTELQNLLDSYNDMIMFISDTDIGLRELQRVLIRANGMYEGIKAVADKEGFNIIYDGEKEIIVDK